MASSYKMTCAVPAQKALFSVAAYFSEKASVRNVAGVAARIAVHRQRSCLVEER